jgi:dephospho-CoA kinase
MSGGRQPELNARLIRDLDRSRSAAIDGLRHPVDFEILSNAFGSSFRLIFLDAREEVRFGRLRSRFSTADLFHAGDSAPVEAHIDGLQALASISITNEGSLESLYRNLDEWVAACEKGKQQ